MNPTSALFSLQNSNPLLAILWAGFTCGTLDISAALVVYRYFGRSPMRLLQGIAAGVLGSRSFQGGLPTALCSAFSVIFSSHFPPPPSTLRRASGYLSFWRKPYSLGFSMAWLFTSS
ncbi:MAG: hypothetical protein DMG82_05360 [Acidobacteria bacterium]|nr:MAG: hypothetical protein DMG82_05360 [Acidobacteriota bacterium]PYX48332.1 MAG: hypothetical protein DMG83_01950 [Acidobacteriota bacterium]